MRFQLSTLSIFVTALCAVTFLFIEYILPKTPSVEIQKVIKTMESLPDSISYEGLLKVSGLPEGRECVPQDLITKERSFCWSFDGGYEMHASFNRFGDEQMEFVSIDSQHPTEPRFMFFWTWARSGMEHKGGQPQSLRPSCPF